MKISTCHHKNLSLLSRKPRLFIISKLTTFYRNGAPLVLPVSRFLDIQHFKKIGVNKFWKIMEQSES